MKKYLWIAGISVALAGLASLAYAVERQTAVADTNSTLELIDSGLDWEGQTPISQQKQTARMDANVAVLADQQGQRNSSGLLGLALLSTGVGIVVAGKKAA